MLTRRRKRILWTFALALIALLCGICIGCRRQGENTVGSIPSETVEDSDHKIVIGFSQLGAESDWRMANTKSMKSTFTSADGYELIIEDGQQKQTNQITSIRRFIQQGVDYIVLAPVMETGWDTVLEEAWDAGIPVIIVDRMVDIEDEALFTSWVGSNFELEGKKAAEWLHEYCLDVGFEESELRIVDLQGTMGATAQIGRTKGLSEMAKTYGWNVLDFVEADFTQAKGREVMTGLLNQYDSINVVYCENDNEAIGAIEAIEGAGFKCGSDISAGEIMVISFDGINSEAQEYLLEDKISVIAECNPLLGPRVESIIEALEAGLTPEKYTYVDESLFVSKDNIDKITVDGAYYEVTLFTDEIRNARNFD